MRVIQRAIEDGIYSVQATLTLLDEGACVYLFGGQTHIGAVVLALPRESLRRDGSISCTSSVLNVLGHQDELVARPCAERLCRESGQPVTVTAGLHLERASAQEIERLRANAEALTQLLSEAWATER